MEDLRISNRKFIYEKSKNNTVINEMESIRDFIDDYGFLTFGRDYISVKNYVFSLQKILISAELTISNMIDCCKNGCFADANILLRKYRDDLFFALYVVVYDASKKITTSIDNEKIEKNIEKWLQNNLSDLQINTVLMQVGNYPYVEKAVKKYNLQKTFSEISTRLNNFVHGNGFSFYNQNVLAYKDEELFDQLSQINEDLRFITITFLFLIILCSPLYIMSTDYIDFLEMGQTPPDGSQYYVASFIEKFISNNIYLLGKDCFQYLKDNTCMNFN